MERESPPPFPFKISIFFIHVLLVLNLQGFEVKLARKLIPSITKLFIPSQLLVILVFLFSILQMPIPGWPLMAGFLCASWGDLWQDGSPDHFAAHAHPPWWAALALQCWKWRWSWHKFSTGSDVPLSGIAVEAQSPPYSSFTAAHIWLISCQVKLPLSMLKQECSHHHSWLETNHTILYLQTQIIANIVQFAFILFTMAKEEKVNNNKQRCTN